MSWYLMAGFSIWWLIGVACMVWAITAREDLKVSDLLPMGLVGICGPLVLFIFWDRTMGTIFGDKVLIKRRD